MLTAQLGVGNTSSPGVTDEGITLGGFEVSLIRCGWKGFFHEVELGNMRNASLSTDSSWSASVSLNLMLSAWSPSVTVITDRGAFTYTLHIGAIGAGIEWGHPGYINFKMLIGFIQQGPKSVIPRSGATWESPGTRLSQHFTRRLPRPTGSQ